MIYKAHQLHKKANELCFIANSINFTVKHHPTIKHLIEHTPKRMDISKVQDSLF
jgi:hypothetical protein